MGNKHIGFHEAASKALKPDEVRVVLTWRNNNNYVKDLDLHLLVPNPPLISKEARKITRGHHANNSTDLSGHPERHDSKYHVFWDKKGHARSPPFARYELDYGSEGLGGGGPESIRTFKVFLNREYLFWVDCWSCDEKEDEWGDDVEIPLTKTALQQFLDSDATVKMYHGHEQIYCANIGSAKGKVRTQWDVAKLVCNGKELVSSYDSDHRCHITPIHDFNKNANTIKDWNPKYHPGFKSSIGDKSLEAVKHAKRAMKKLDQKEEKGLDKKKQQKKITKIKRKVMKKVLRTVRFV